MLYPISYLESLDREDFTNPFRYCPHPLVRLAAAEVLSRLAEWKVRANGSYERELERSFAEGKMLGVLICRPKNTSDNAFFYIAGFSGTVRGSDGKVTSTVDGFVPPIIDLTSPDGYFKLKEAEISQINQQISELSSSTTLEELKEIQKKYRLQQEVEIQDMQKQILISKQQREELRKTTTDSSILAELIKESQFQKAELKRLKDKWKEALGHISSEIVQFEGEISILKKKRAQMSDELQKWIFENAIVHNASGDISSIWNIFTSNNLTPPGGTGDCAAPKLLEYAYKNNLVPLAMGEFWYGLSPETAVRTHGHFYPSCTSKCGPLLGYMMQGLQIKSEKDMVIQSPIIIHEDDSIIVVEKPSGMPSVPGLDGRESLQEWLSQERGEIHSVHRLDMDTSGVMIYAKTEDAAVNLRKQFEEHTVRKTYIARLISNIYLNDKKVEQNAAEDIVPEAGKQREEWRNTTGAIKLPLSPDYDERPRQKVDFKQGKPAHTDYKVLQTNPDGTTDILLYPLTGRTHQLRVHCAHALGLARPIAGDLLYGSHTAHLPNALTQPNTSYSPTVHSSTLQPEGHSLTFLQEGHPSRLHPTAHPSTIQPEGHPSRLCLHALSITFTHPLTGATQTHTSDRLSF